MEKQESLLKVLLKPNKEETGIVQFNSIMKETWLDYKKLLWTDPQENEIKPDVNEQADLFNVTESARDAQGFKSNITGIAVLNTGRLNFMFASIV